VGQWATAYGIQTLPYTPLSAPRCGKHLVLSFMDAMPVLSVIYVPRYDVLHARCAFVGRADPASVVHSGTGPHKINQGETHINGSSHFQRFVWATALHTNPNTLLTAATCLPDHVQNPTSGSTTTSTKSALLPIDVLPIHLPEASRNTSNSCLMDSCPFVVAYDVVLSGASWAACTHAAREHWLLETEPQLNTFARTSNSGGTAAVVSSSALVTPS
jgi:hypothetical protein